MKKSLNLSLIIIVFLFILPPFFLSGCTKKEEKLKVTSISDTTIYNFLNEVIPTEKETLEMNIFVDSNRMNTSDTIKGYDLHWAFNSEDSIFAVYQLISSDVFVLDKKLLKDVKIESYSPLKYSKEKIINRLNDSISFKDWGYNFICRPVFSLDLSKCILVFGYECGGLCGKGRKCIYRRENGKWKFHQSLGGYIS